MQLGQLVAKLAVAVLAALGVLHASAFAPSALDRALVQFQAQAVTWTPSTPQGAMQRAADPLLAALYRAQDHGGASVTTAQLVADLAGLVAVRDPQAWLAHFDADARSLDG